MKKLFLSCIVLGFSLGIASLGTSQEVNDQACKQTLEANCVKCHPMKKTCKELDKADANWKTIIAEMGKRGKLSQEVQDTVLACLTTTPDPKKIACDK